MADAGTDEAPKRREQILSAARKASKSHGYNGLNFRNLAAQVGITSASLHYHFPTKADLGEALARQYREQAARELAELADRVADLSGRFTGYTAIFRRALGDGNQLCLASQFSAEYDDLPLPVRDELAAFAEVNTGWIKQVLIDAGEPEQRAEARAAAIFAAISGAQLAARSRSDIAVFDTTVAAYRELGLLP
jgi:TetR/AcrR family transcriptional repressor of nem operon